jgi:hypothetical protein
MARKGRENRHVSPNYAPLGGSLASLLPFAIIVAVACSAARADSDDGIVRMKSAVSISEAIIRLAENSRLVEDYQKIVAASMFSAPMSSAMPAKSLSTSSASQ